MTETYLPVRELPPCLRAALEAQGYRRPDVRVREAATYCPQDARAGFEGNRGYCVAVNLETGETRSVTGSWGGSGFTTNPVDHDSTSYPIPSNGALIQGESGGRGAFATVLVPPNGLLRALPMTTEVSDEERRALRIIKGYRPSGRGDEFDRADLGVYGASNPLVQSLASKGLVKVNRAGAIQITTDGKNAAK